MIKAEVFELLEKKQSVVSSMEMPKIGKFCIVFQDELQQKELIHFFHLISNDIFFDGKDRYGHDVNSVGV